MRRDVFQAISDPTRRAIIGMIASQPHNINTIAAQFDMSRPAVSKHMKVLAECGLIEVKKQGRERICNAKLEPLNEVHEWVDQFRKLWLDRFENIDQYLIQLQNKPNHHGNK